MSSEANEIKSIMHEYREMLTEHIKYETHKMKKSILFLTAATLLVAASCQNFKKGEGGLEYKIVKDAGAEKAVAGDLLSVDMTLTSDRKDGDGKDSLLNSTYDMGLPQIINIAPDSL